MNDGGSWSHAHAWPVSHMTWEWLSLCPPGSCRLPYHGSTSDPLVTHFVNIILGPAGAGSWKHLGQMNFFPSREPCTYSLSLRLCLPSNSREDSSDSTPCFGNQVHERWSSAPPPSTPAPAQYNPSTMFSLEPAINSVCGWQGWCVCGEQWWLFLLKTILGNLRRTKHYKSYHSEAAIVYILINFPSFPTHPLV